jgi:hypothetical protein
MRRSALAFVVGCTLIGCTAAIDGPSSVTGSWGSDDFDLAAGIGGATVSSPCYTVTFPLHAPLINGESFALTGTVTRSSSPSQVGQQWRLSGIARRDTIVATLSWRATATPESPDPAWQGPYSATFAGAPRTDRIHVCPL